MLHNHTQPAGIILANESTQYHWHLCMAGYLCPMPLASFFVASPCANRRHHSMLHNNARTAGIIIAE